MVSLASFLTSALLFISLATAISYFVLYYLIYSRRVAQWRKSKIPYLQPCFLFGHKYFRKAIDKAPLMTINRIYRENPDKDVVAFFFLTVPMILIRNPAVITQVLAKNLDKAFAFGVAGAKADKIAHHSLALATSKAVWQSDQKTLAPMFATARMSGEAFVKISKQIGTLLTHVETVRCQGKPVDTRQVARNFMMDCTSHSFFGLEANSHVKEGDFSRLLNSVAIPNWFYAMLAYLALNFGGDNDFRTYLFAERHVNVVNSFINQRIEERRQQETDENDLVDLFLRLKNGHEDLDDVTSQMAAYTYIMSMGAHFGVTNLASFTLHLLSLYPEHQERIKNEVDDVMKKHETSEFTFEVVQDLCFTRQCLREASRLYPLLIFTRLCSEDIKIPGTDYVFTKGERVVVDPYSLHHDPKYFKNPEEFDPERFSPDNIKATSEYLLSFGLGGRKCPGINIGFLMLATFVGSMVHKYEIKPHSHMKQIDVNDFHPKGFANVPRESILVDIVPRQSQ